MAGPRSWGLVAAVLHDRSGEFHFAIGSPMDERRYRINHSGEVHGETLTSGAFADKFSAAIAPSPTPAGAAAARTAPDGPGEERVEHAAWPHVEQGARGHPGVLGDQDPVHDRRR